MSCQSFPRVPVNPRLEFGVPLKKVCKKGILHPGLRELFLKAYLSAGGEDRTSDEHFKGASKTPYVLEALKAGPKGQGSLAERISLKLKLESGKWIVAAQTPMGAPLWLLRHFLGCLPRPILHESHWRMIAVACRFVSCPKNNDHDDDILGKILEALEALPTENYSTLVALVLLIRNLSVATQKNELDSVTLHEEAVEALSQYFIAAIISRPYRPGLYTTLDKEHKPLLLFLTKRWLEVKELGRHSGISRYHITCHLPYELASPGREVDYIVWRAMTTADDITDKIAVQERKSKNVRASKNGVRIIDAAVRSNVQKADVIQGDGVPTTVHTPIGVYLIPSKVESISTSLTDEEVSGKVTEDSSDTLVHLTDTDFDQGYVHLEVQKIDGFECLRLRKLLKDKSINNPTFDVKKLISKYERRGIVFAGAYQGFKSDDLPPKTKVMGRVEAKTDGTQTFECEFSEDKPATEIGGMQERVDKVQASASPRIEIVKHTDMQLRSTENILAIVNIGSPNISEFSKVHKNKAVVPLTKSTALLIKRLASDEEIVYFPATQVYQAMTPMKKTCVSEAVKDVKTLKNPINNDAKKSINQKEKFCNNDFVWELKNNFEQGRRKPSDAKLSSKIVLAADNLAGQDAATAIGQGSSKARHLAQVLFSRKVINLRGLADSSSTQELLQKKSNEAVSSASSI